MHEKLNPIHKTPLKKLCVLLLFLLNAFCIILFLLYTRFTVNHKIHTITETESGFVPSTITINIGDTVVFKSGTKDYFWPASDPHPTHTLFSAFDPKAPLKADNTWSFTFSKVGTWPYHDHLMPIFRGLITVEDPNVAQKVTPDVCKNASLKQLCWKQEIEKAVKQNGVEQAFNLIDALYQSDPSFIGSCHDMTHYLGQVAYETYINKHTTVASRKANYCGYGFYHSFMENLLHDKKDYTVAREFCDGISKQFGKSAYLACFHGIGHGLLEDVPKPTLLKPLPTLIKEALTTCEHIAKTNEELERCSSGVFNVIALYYTNPNVQTTKDANHPFAACLPITKEYERKACFDQMNLYLYSLNKTFAKSLVPILQLKDQTDQLHSLHGLGSLVGVNFVDNTSLSPLIMDCQKLPPHLTTMCISSIAQGLIEGGKPGKEYIQALNFCQEKLLKSTQKQACFAAVLNMTQQIYPNDLPPQVCDVISQFDSSLCKKT